MQFVPVLDAAIAKIPGYEAYDSGVNKDVFIKNYQNSSEYFTGQGRAGDSVYPDFFKNETKQWWLNAINKLYQDVGFDGLWLDMNEATNFCDGSCNKDQAPLFQAKNKLDYIPTGRDLET